MFFTFTGRFAGFSFIERNVIFIDRPTEGLANESTSEVQASETVVERDDPRAEPERPDDPREVDVEGAEKYLDRLAADVMELKLIVAVKRGRDLEKRLNGEDKGMIERILRTTIDEEIIRFFAGSKDVSWRQSVARNLNTPQEVLNELAGDKNLKIKWGVAGNPSTSTDTLNKLASDKESSDIRVAVAGNPGNSADALSKLARDKDRDVRVAVAGNPSASTDTLDRLADDIDHRTRWNVAGNPSTSTDTLDRQIRNESSEIRRRAEENLRSIKSLFNER